MPAERVKNNNGGWKGALSLTGWGGGLQKERRAFTFLLCGALTKASQTKIGGDRHKTETLIARRLSLAISEGGK